jgi:hypothetical protein
MLNRKLIFQLSLFGLAMAMLLIGPFFGILSGLILGLFAFIASKILKKNPVCFNVIE